MHCEGADTQPGHAGQEQGISLGVQTPQGIADRRACGSTARLRRISACSSCSEVGIGAGASGCRSDAFISSGIITEHISYPLTAHAGMHLRSRQLLAAREPTLAR